MGGGSGCTPTIVDAVDAGFNVNKIKSDTVWFNSNEEYVDSVKVTLRCVKELL